MSYLINPVTEDRCVFLSSGLEIQSWQSVSFSQPILAKRLPPVKNHFRKRTAVARVWARPQSSALAAAFASRREAVRFLTISIRSNRTL